MRGDPLTSDPLLPWLQARGVAVAEQELLAEIQRRQARQPAQPGEARKSRRPAMMRGLMI